MRKLIVFGFAVLAISFAYLPTAQAGSLAGLSLGPSNGGVLFAPDANGVTGSLGVNFEDGCIAGQTSCTFSDVTGNLLDLGNTIGTYDLAFNSTPFLANFNGPGSWAFASGATSDYTLLAGGGGITGVITWLSISEISGADSLTGSATFAGTGSLAFVGSGTQSFTLDLNTLSCSGLPLSTPCSLNNISLDPPQGFANFGSGTFGGSSGGQTPEPGTLLLLGSGLLGLAAFVRTKFGGV